MQPVPAAAWRLPAGQRVHRVAPRTRSLPSVQAAHAPEMAFRLDPKVFAMVPEQVTQSVERSKPIQNVFNQVLRDLQVPRSVLPTMGEMIKDQIRDEAPAESQAQMLARYAEDL
jgi:hypothetical protein